MATLVSMKLSSTEAKEATTAVDKAEGPRYPWGLSIQLDEDALEKLALTELPDVDETRQLVARVQVTSVSSHQTTGGGKRRSLSLQITHLALEADPPARSAADKLYGSES